MNRCDIEIERAVLGEIMVFDDLRSKVSLLEPDDFAYSEHGVICRAMINQSQQNKSFDFITLANACGAEYREIIQACVQTAISQVMFDEHFRLLKEMASRRRLTESFRRLSFNGEVSVPNLQKIIDDENSKRLINDIVQTGGKNIEGFVAGLNMRKGAVMTGFGKVDRVLGGIRRGTVFIIGARPSTGKTTLALNIAANQLADPDKKVIFFSLEMSADMILERLMSAQNGIEYERFGRNALSDDELAVITERSHRLKDEGRFTVLDDVYNVEHMCNLISEHKPSLAVVDFMQIISASGKFENVRNRIDYISAMFKRTAKATGCVILVLSQLSRIGDSAPTMSDLKESGGLEQDGDYIALLHRPYIATKREGAHPPEETELMLDKNKFGRTGNVHLYFDLRHQKFYERDDWHESRVDRSGAAFEE